MIRFICSYLFLFCFTVNIAGQVDFNEDSFDEIFAQGNLDKPVFVDVYTTWCGPCKLMNQTTFLDTSVATLLHDNFHILKWDAEDERYRDDVKKLGVIAYPTYLFLSTEGTLISKPSGYKEIGEFIKMTQEVMALMQADPLSNQDLSSLTLEESHALLEKITLLESPDKLTLTQQIIEQLGDSDKLWDNYALTLASNAYDQMDIDVIQKTLEHLPSAPSVFSKEEFQAYYTAKNNLSRILDYQASNAKKASDYQSYLHISELKAVAKNTSLNNQDAKMAKDIRTDRLDYYEFNKVAEHYKPLADSMIAEHILPHSPEKVKKADEQLSKNRGRFSDMMPDIEESALDSTSREFYETQHYNGVNMADRLVNVAQAIIEIYEDSESHRAALNYAILAIEYADLPRYLMTKAKIEYLIGDQKSVDDTLIALKQHQFYDPEEHDLSF